MSTQEEVTAGRKADRPAPYTPGHHKHLLPVPGQGALVPLLSRAWQTALVLLGLFLIAYGGYGLLTGDLYLPGKRSPGTHYQGAAALLVFAVLVNVAAWLMAAAFARFDTLTHKASTAHLSKWPFAGAIGLLIAGVVMLILE